MPITMGILTASRLPKVTYIGSASSTASVGSYTFNNVNIGTATPDRLVVVVASFHNGSSNTLNPLSTITIGGTAGTVHVAGGESEGSGGNSNSFGIGSRLVTTGTTATIIADCANSADSCSIHVYNVTDYRNATPTTYSNTNSDPISIALASHPNSIAVGGAVSLNSSALVYSSSGTVQPTNNGQFTAGSRIRSGFNLTDASGSPTLSVAFTGSNSDECFYAAVWS